MNVFKLQVRRLLACAAVLALVSGCVNQGQSRYMEAEVGKASLVEFGTVVASRQVEIKGQQSGAGAAVGGAAGGIAMAGVGSGSGNAAAILGGVVVGAVAGAMAEQAMKDRYGVEYVITLQNGKTITIVQEQIKGDVIFRAGDRVMVQASGTFQRVLPADSLPTEINRPKGIQVKD
jgi:outer membrane lipoprotein SlyB